MSAPHDGPPYPILVDEPVGEGTFSIWADPDVGVGTFYYYVEPGVGAEAGAGARAGLRVLASAAPADGTAERREAWSEPAEPHEPFDLVGELPYSHRGLWPTRFEVWSAAEPEARLAEFTLEVDVTPPGLGAIDILWFAFPFAAVGFLWVKTLLARRGQDTDA